MTTTSPGSGPAPRIRAWRAKRRAALLLLLPLLARSFAGPAALSPEDAAAAGRVAGVEFSTAENRQMLGRIENHLRALAELRASKLPESVAPALIFDPRPAGFVMPPPGKIEIPIPLAIEVPANREELAYYSVVQLAGLIGSRKVTSEELTRLALARLERFGPPLRCVVTLTRERALAAAREADREIQANHWRGPLHGIPYGVKDLLDVAGAPSTWGVSPRTNGLAVADATVVRKLGEAGAILVAKLSLGELAMGDVWYGGLTRNPWKPATGSSGSSAGSASAVSAGLVPFAIGSETLGSIVSPATVCGVTGLRPTYGRVSRAGAMTLSFSLDKLGPIARSAEDCALVLEVIRCPDNQDRSVVDAPFHVPADLATLRVGFLESDFARDYANRTNDRAALEVIRRLGFELKPVALPRAPKGILYSLLNAEAAASFDALTRSNDDDRLVQQGDGSWPNVFRAARFMTAVDYLQANRVRAVLIGELDAIFREVDVLLAPTWSGNQLLQSNMAGLPCVVVPNGALGGEHPPSICFLAGLYREGSALALARAFQNATPWDEQHPSLGALGKSAGSGESSE